MHHDLHHHHHHHPQKAQMPSRRDFFRAATGGALLGASILKMAAYRAAWAQALAPTANSQLFELGL